MRIMATILALFGFVLCFFGLLGLAAVIYLGFQIRKQAETRDNIEKKTTFETLIIINYLALCLSGFGLIILVVGIFIG